ncbi:MAG: T9SS type A sorting domain-containing protein [Bacteroidales bacterium]|nr:T9SS type A sorting domain-containing protein [Bacteroidales bacterium]
MKRYLKIIPVIVLLAFWLIPALNQAQGIEIPSGGSMVITGAASIEISNGSLINNGTYTKGSETFTLSGATTPREISGTALTDFNNLTISNTAGVSIAVNSKVTVSGTLTNSVGATGLVLKSNATGTGSLISSTAAIAGTIERHIVGGWGTADAGWHSISSPVASQVISAFETSGAGNSYDFYGWAENTNTWMNYKDAGFSLWNSGTTFNSGQGYLISYEATQTGKSFAGNIQVADITATNQTYTAGAAQGFHLMGNPFSSALIWNDGNWALTNVAGTAKIWNESGKSYTDINASGIIPSAQGFMIQVSSGTNSITIPAVSRTHNGASYYKAGSGQQIKLLASELDGASFQEIQIILNENATQNFDFDYDSRFLPGYAPQFYSVCENENLSTNSIPSITSELVIPLGFVKNQADNYKIELKESIDGQSIYLTDTKLQTIQKLNENPVYSFTSADNDMPDRFLLHFGVVGVGEQNDKDVLQTYVYDHQLYVINQIGKAQLRIFDIQGRLIQTNFLNTDGMHNQVLNLPAGAYVMRLESAINSNTLKFILE